MSKIAVVKGDERKKNILEALKLIEKDIDMSIVKKGKDTLFIKVNTTDTKIPISSTDPDALEAVIEFFHKKFKEIIVGDNSPTFLAGSNPYMNVKEFYPNIEFSDLTNFDSKEMSFKSYKRGNVKVRISLLPKQAYTISLAIPKSHDAVVFTGSAKNMLGCVLTQKWMAHGMKPYDRLIKKNSIISNRFTHMNMVELIRNSLPDLGILDGFVAMEGDGPVLGTPVDLKLAMCSLDPVSLDLFASKICSFNNVWYLNQCAEVGLGSTEATVLNSGFKEIDEIKKKFRPHRNYKYMLMDLGLEKGFLSVDVAFLRLMFLKPKRLVKKVIWFLRH